MGPFVSGHVDAVRVAENVADVEQVVLDTAVLDRILGLLEASVGHGTQLLDCVNLLADEQGGEDGGRGERLLDQGVTGELRLGLLRRRGLVAERGHHRVGCLDEQVGVGDVRTQGHGGGTEVVGHFIPSRLVCANSITDATGYKVKDFTP